MILYIGIPGFRWYDAMVLKSFLIGLQFDSVVLAYTLSIPAILLFFHYMLNLQGRIITKTIIIYATIVFPLLFFTAIADIPYFKFFGNRLSESSFQWMGNPGMVFGLITGTSEYLFFLIIAIIFLCFSGFLMYKFSKNQLLLTDWKQEFLKIKRPKALAFFLIIIVLCFAGMRGKKSRPIMVGDAFFCDNQFLNQVGLNPVFTIVKSYTSSVNIMDNHSAIENTQHFLQITHPVDAVSPIARFEKSNQHIPIQKPNIVLVLMESMSASYMKSFGNDKNLTPVLDSLAGQSMFFTRFYSAGIHTNNGIFSSLYGFPALKRTRPMVTQPVRTYSGLPYVLKQNGYNNLFFTTQAKEWDNLGAFITKNYFDTLHSAENYPADKIISVFGVSDDYMFSYALNVIRKTDSTAPFFATLLTVCNHDPYIVPEYFKSPFTEKDLKAVSYTDWSIGQFMKQASETSWFKNTLFVFVADHGLNIDHSPYEVSLAYHHIPLIIYAPEIVKPQIINDFAGQIDIFPILMGILNFDYMNNTLGVNVLKQKRDCIYFSSDDKLCCINDEWLYVYNFGGKQSLYRYNSNEPINYFSGNTGIASQLRNYAFSQTQVAQWIFNHDKSRIPIVK